MRITISTSSYNDRRLGKPWIAKVDFTDPKGDFSFGQWIGASGEAGELQIDAEPGDVIAQGQKDARRYSAPDYRIVQADGTLGEVVTKVEAYKTWQANHASPAAPAIDLSAVSTDELIAELRRRGTAI